MRLTDIASKRLPAPARGNKITYDDAVKGFGFRITAGDARAFVLNYRRKLDGRERRVTIGSYPDWSTAAAREEAKRLKREIDGGADPVGELGGEPRSSRPLPIFARGSSAITSRASGHRPNGSTGSRLPLTSCLRLAA